jgi:hypothetical protein
VLSRDFRREQGRYEDFDNLFAMYVLYNMGRHSVRINGETKLLEIDKSKVPMRYPEAAEHATQSARSDSENFRRRTPFSARGTGFDGPADDARF